MDAAAELKRLGIPEEELRSEWAAQVREQTKPVPRMLFFLLCCMITHGFVVNREVQSQGQTGCTGCTRAG